MKRSLSSGMFIFLGVLVSAVAGFAAGGPEQTRYLRDITVEQGHSSGDTVCFGCSVKVLGTVQGDVVTIGGDISVAGTVEGDVVTVGGRLLLLPGSRATGEAVAVGGGIERDVTAQVREGTEAFPYFHLPGQRSFSAPGSLTFIGVNLILVLLGGMIVGENRAEKMSGCLRRRPWLSSITGLLALGIFTVLFTIAARSGPLVPYLESSLALLLIALLFFGYLGCCWTVGRSLAPHRGKVPTWLLGAGACTLVLLVPVVGFVASATILFLAPGLAITTWFGGDGNWLLGRLKRHPS